jgi:hypothetical protein
MKLIWWKLKISTILSILVLMVHPLSAICFCISSYVYQHLHSLDCQHFAHYSSLVLFTYLRTIHGAGLHFWRGPTIFKMFKNTICKGVCTVTCSEKRFYPFLPPSFFFLNVSPIKNLKEALNISTWMYCNIHLLEIMRRSAFKSPLSYPSS